MHCLALLSRNTTPHITSISICWLKLHQRHMQCKRAMNIVCQPFLHNLLRCAIAGLRTTETKWFEAILIELRLWAERLEGTTGLLRYPALGVELRGAESLSLSACWMMSDTPSPANENSIKQTMCWLHTLIGQAWFEWKDTLALQCYHSAVNGIPK